METDHSEIFIDNICKSIDIKLSRRIEDYKILLSTYNDMTDIIGFIKKEQHKIRESLSTGFYRHSDILIKYQEYLENSTSKVDKRRKAIFFLIYSMAIQNSDVSMKRLLDPIEYHKVRKTPFVKSYIDKIVNLEYIHFLSVEINKFSAKPTTFSSSTNNGNSINHPFEDDNMYELFKYIINNWEYDKDLKYAYIFNEIMPEGHQPKEYEKFIRNNFKPIGKFNYNNAVSTNIITELRNLIKKKYR